jgi:predicted metal-dependent HD superfamily phosphohydrolase
MSQLHLGLPPQSLVLDSLLRERFLALWRACLLPGALSDPVAVWSSLERRYAELHRRYHDLNHLAHCLEELDAAAGHVAEPRRVEMAIWFHDVINDPGSRDNEQRSADYFRGKADGLIDRDFIDAVVGLIMVTTHREPPSDPDQQFICDIDLASFGCPWECFMRDSSNVKAEFSGPEEDYYRGKKAFLQAMLARPRIFLTDFFNARYERQARDNIARLLDLLDQHRD